MKMKKINKKYMGMEKMAQEFEEMNANSFEGVSSEDSLKRGYQSRSLVSGNTTTNKQRNNITSKDKQESAHSSMQGILSAVDFMGVNVGLNQSNSSVENSNNNSSNNSPGGSNASLGNSPGNPVKTHRDSLGGKPKYSAGPAVLRTGNAKEVLENFYKTGNPASTTAADLRAANTERKMRFFYFYFILFY
jgi:hypothetical protein